MQKINNFTLIKHAVPHTNIHRHVSICSTTIIRIPYKNTDKVQQLSKFYKRNLLLLQLISPYGHKVSNYVAALMLQTDKIILMFC